MLLCKVVILKKFCFFYFSVGLATKDLKKTPIMAFQWLQLLFSPENVIKSAALYYFSAAVMTKQPCPSIRLNKSCWIGFCLALHPVHLRFNAVNDSLFPSKISQAIHFHVSSTNPSDYMVIALRSVYTTHRSSNMCLFKILTWPQIILSSTEEMEACA